MKQFLSFFLLIYLSLLQTLVFAGFDKDPLKETQTNSVPVTEEMLHREGEPGPSSPSFPFQDSSRFLSKNPYEKAETHSQDEEEDKDHFWDKWFFWRKNDSSQDVDNK